MTFITSAVLFILKLLLLLFVLGLIILVHEFGHFMWAKKFKVYIYEFSIGMGPVAFSWKGKKDKITYNIRWIPIGGFVSMAGEVYDDDDKIPKKQLLCNKPWYQRLIIMVAGVVNNFLLAIAGFIIIAFIWGGDPIKPVIDKVYVNSPAYEAGMQSGDVITSINGYDVSNWDKARVIMVYKNKNDYTTFTVEHKNGKEEKIKVTPGKFKDETGEETEGYGISMAKDDTSGFFKPILYAFKRFGSIVDSFVYTIWGLISGKVSFDNLSGPVGMYSMVGSAFNYSAISESIWYIMFLIAYLSINVGFINILPFPAFDGGHVLFLLIEAIVRRKVDAKIENICHTIGFILIFLLMIAVTFNDIARIIGKLF